MAEELIKPVERKRNWKKILAWFVGISFTLSFAFVLCVHLLISKGVGGTSDYIQSDFSKVYVNVMSYERPSDGTTLLLLPMSHIAQDSFYEKVSQQLENADIILTEGVNDRQNRLNIKGKIGYANVAHIFGLSEQQAFRNRTAVNADGDLSVLKEESVELLKKLFSMIGSYGTEEFMDKFKDYAEFAEKNPTVTEKTMQDILTLRNDVLVQSLQAVLKDGEAIKEKLKLDQEGMLLKLGLKTSSAKTTEIQSTLEEQQNKVASLYQNMNNAINDFLALKKEKRLIAIPWGAKHFDELIPQFEEMGFVKKKESSLEIARFGHVYASIFSHLFSSEN